MGKIIGIDLGTTNSVAAIAAGVQPKVLDNKAGKTQTRSVVGWKKAKRKKRKEGSGGDGKPEILVGEVAVDYWAMAPKDTIVSVKRLMGRRFDDPDVQKVRAEALYDIVKPSDGTKDSVAVVMGGKEYSPVDISAMILRKLKEDAEFRLGEEVTHAVITVPAYFSQRQKGDTREAGLKAGLKVIKILEEPTAAAIAFGMEAKESAEPKYILVYDLGGGTFDISVLMWAGNVFAPLDLEGDMWLGGDNFDQVIVDHVVKHIKEEYDVDPTGNMRFMVALKKAAQAAKERLSSERSTDLILPQVLQDEEGDYIDVDLEITVAEFNRMIASLVARTVELVAKALKRAELTPDQIDHVIMAGNSTCVPLVQEAMEKMFGKEKVMRNVHPKHSVAIGAAVLAARIGLDWIVCQAPDPSAPDRECGHLNKTDATVCENCGAPLKLAEPAPDAEGEAEGSRIRPIDPYVMAPFYYGAQTTGDKFNVFIEKGEACPTANPKTQTFYTLRPNQRMISIPVYARDDAEKPEDVNEKQGEAFALLPPALPEGTGIRIKLWLDGDGVFELEAHLEDGTDLRPWVLKGKADQKAYEAIEQVEEKVARKAKDTSAAHAAELEAAREEAFRKMKKRDFKGAEECVERMEEIVGRPPEEEGLAERAERLIGWSQYLVHQYGWGFPADRVHRINTLIGEVQEALGSNDKATLKQKVSELDRATDNLPQLVSLLLGIRAAIQTRLRPQDPVAAESCLAELEDVEVSLKAGDRSGLNKLKSLAEEVHRKIQDVGRKPEGNVCVKCEKPIPPGTRRCPHCDADQWELRHKQAGGTSGIGL